MHQLIKRIVIWAFLWGAGWIGFFQLNKRGIDYIKKYGITVAYFSVISSIIICVFRNEYTKYISELNIISFVSLFFFYVISIFFYSSVKEGPQNMIKEHPKAHFLKLDNRYLLSKSAEIFFQQLLIVLLVTWLYDAGFSAHQIIFSFAAVFGLGHVYLLHMRGLFFGSIFSICSFLSAFILPILILFVPSGIVYSYLVHWIFYIALGFYFWKLS